MKKQIACIDRKIDVNGVHLLMLQKNLYIKMSRKRIHGMWPHNYTLGEIEHGKVNIFFFY